MYSIESHVWRQARSFSEELVILAHKNVVFILRNKFSRSQVLISMNVFIEETPHS